MPKTWEIGGGDNSNSTGAGATAFWAVPESTQNDTEIRVEHAVYETYTLKNLLIRVVSNFTTAASTVRSRKNQGNGAQSVSVPDAATGLFEDTTNSDSLVSGDTYCLQVVAGAGGAFVHTVAGFLLEHASDDVPLLGAARSQFIGAGATRYFHIGGAAAAGLDETDRQYTVRAEATLKNLRCRTSTSNTADSTFAVRVNTNTSALSITIAGGTSGVFENTTNSVAVVAGDEINYIITIGGGAGSISFANWQVQYNSVARPTLCADDAVAFSADRYLMPEGGVIGAITTESQAQHKARVAFNAKNLFVNVTAHGASSGVNVYLRVGGNNTALTVAIAASTTGFFEDTTNTVSVADQDLFNYLVDHGGGAGTCSISAVGFGLEQSAPGRRTGTLTGVGT